MIITQINLINTNIKKNPFNKQITVPFLKEGFDLQNKDIVSFGRKKTKEKVDKNKIYKQLRKAGCGEKDTNSIINNDKKYKHLLSLMENAYELENLLFTILYPNALQYTGYASNWYRLAQRIISSNFIQEWDAHS